MQEVLILGASGGIATLVERIMIDDPNVHLTLLARRRARLATDVRDDPRADVVIADVLNRDELVAAMAGKDLVYANLYGADLGAQGDAVVDAMHESGVRRVVWISANGIYGEIPGDYGRWNAATLGSTLEAYAQGAKAIEDSDLDYTIVRPAWFSDKDEVNYELTRKGEPFKGTEVSRRSVATYVASLIADPGKEIRGSVGISEPNTDGPKPSFR